MEEMIKSGRVKRSGGPVSRPKMESDSEDADQNLMVTAVGGSLKNREDQE